VKKIIVVLVMLAVFTSMGAAQTPGIFGISLGMIPSTPESISASLKRVLLLFMKTGSIKL